MTERAGLATAPDGAREPACHVGLLAGFDARVAGRPVRLQGRKARALLAYLALHPARGESRERLAGLLWGDATEPQARASLRQVTAELRGAFAEAGLPGWPSGRDTLSLAGLGLRTDVEDALARIAAGEVPAALREAGGRPADLLAGHEDLSPGFQDWLLAMREAVATRLCHALEAAMSEAALPPRRRRTLAEALLRLDPLHEEACRAVMRLAAEAGETGAALRAYAALYDQLGADLDMEPAAATQELVAEIKSGRLVPAGPAPPPVTTRPMLGGRVELLRASGAPVVAVLPFRCAAPDDAQWAGEGVMEEIVAMLASVREPVVISANTTRHLRERDLPLPAIAAAVGADYVVSGSLRGAQGSCRLAVELAEATTGAVLWAQVYALEARELFDVQATIAVRIASTLVPRIGAAELRLSRRAPQNLGAYHLMLEARDRMLRLERGAVEQAGALLQRAVASDPLYAPIHAALCEWHTLRLLQGWSADPKEDEAAVTRSGRDALAIDPSYPRMLALWGHTRTVTARRHEEAVPLVDRAVALAPNDPEALAWSVPTLAFVGRGKEALERVAWALALSPEDPFLFRNEHFRGIAHYAAGDYDAAADWGLRSARRQPGYTSNLRMTTAALAACGRLAEAQDLAAQIVTLQPDIRADSFRERSGFQDLATRARFSEHLVLAGLPR